MFSHHTHIHFNPMVVSSFYYNVATLAVNPE